MEILTIKLFLERFGDRLATVSNRNHFYVVLKRLRDDGRISVDVLAPPAYAGGPFEVKDPEMLIEIINSRPRAKRKGIIKKC